METKGVQCPFVQRENELQKLQIENFGKRTNEILASWPRLLNERMKLL